MAKTSSSTKKTPAAKKATAKKTAASATKTADSEPAAKKTAAKAPAKRSKKPLTIEVPIPDGEGFREIARFSDEDLNGFRENIRRVRIESVEEFQILKEHLEDLNNSEQADENASYSMHMAEQGTEAQEKEKIYAQVQRLNDYIKKLDEALERIENKTYGICRKCFILIARERLLAVPITTLSASFKIQGKCPEDDVDRIIPPGK